MDPKIAEIHKATVWFIYKIIIAVRQNKKTISKSQLIDILRQHPESEEYLGYIKNILLVNCRNGDIITIDRKTDTVRFPIKRGSLGNVIEYHYIK